MNAIEREGKFTIEGKEEKSMEGKPGERNFGAIPKRMIRGGRTGKKC